MRWLRKNILTLFRIVRMSSALLDYPRHTDAGEEQSSNRGCTVTRVANIRDSTVLKYLLQQEVGPAILLHEPAGRGPQYHPLQPETIKRGHTRPRTVVHYGCHTTGLCSHRRSWPSDSRACTRSSYTNLGRSPLRMASARVRSDAALAWQRRTSRRENAAGEVCKGVAVTS